MHPAFFDVLLSAESYFLTNHKIPSSLVSEFTHQPRYAPPISLSWKRPFAGGSSCQHEPSVSESHSRKVRRKIPADSYCASNLLGFPEVWKSKDTTGLHFSLTFGSSAVELGILAQHNSQWSLTPLAVAHLSVVAWLALARLDCRQSSGLGGKLVQLNRRTVPIITTNHQTGLYLVARATTNMVTTNSPNTFH